MSSPAELRWNDQGLLPAVVQEAETAEVLMVAWVDRAALAATQQTGLGHFWSRSRQTLWRKGETSGHVQHVDAIYTDCDRDTLLFQVHQEGPACHTGARTCFFSRLAGEGAGPAGAAAGPATLEIVERVVLARKAEPRPDSYVAGMYAQGEAKICRKIGEEATEVVTAALGGEGDERLVSEIADLWFHCIVLLAGRSIPLRRVFDELARRHASRSRPGPGR
jgi:phosphoribosyl-AMP cyclohydrolase / phosphoribosyl-ATP pyrophosphohydrolase